MIRTSKAPFPFPLPWDKDVTFMIRPGDLMDRGELESVLADLSASPVYDFQLAAAFEEGVRVLLAEAPEDAERLLEIAAADEALELEEKLAPEEAAALSDAREAVRKAWPAYRHLLAQAARRNELLPTIAFQKFVTGWQGNDMPDFRKGIDGLLSLDVMGDIAPIAIRAVGFRAYQALYAASSAKNFVPPSPSDESPAPSESDKPAKAGSSTKRSGNKTRSSRSRAASSQSSTSGSTAGDTATQG